MSTDIKKGVRDMLHTYLNNAEKDIQETNKILASISGVDYVEILDAMYDIQQGISKLDSIIERIK